jgi:hypothetical protein
MAEQTEEQEPELARQQEHLQIVHALMERAVIYRAVSAPIALFTGLVSTGVGGGMVWWFFHSPGLTPRVFVWVWTLAAMACALFAGAWHLRSARLRGETTCKGRARFVMGQMTPALLAASGLTFWHALMIYEIAPLVIYWCIFYGLSLLSVDEYMPRSLVVLGWLFVLAGLLMAPVFYLGLALYGAGPVDGALAMICSFGLIHLIYALTVWPRRGEDRQRLKLRD